MREPGLAVAAGATSWSGISRWILGFISVINGPSLSVLWNEQAGVLASEPPHRIAFCKRNHTSITFESRAALWLRYVCVPFVFHHRQDPPLSGERVVHALFCGERSTLRRIVQQSN
ncbi:uncharacterized protein LOC143211393 isoform X1 [Lasioglossum baleicum]|uniref:uncharacterized protein LOC143211393 isoform X1 n=1 Tax=Lasioglossum baleicum TaxID=434251 RepID=UPI003FCC4565